MDTNKSKKLLAALAALYWALAIMVFLVAGEQFRFTRVTSDAYSASATLGELEDSMVVMQRLEIPADTVESIELLSGTYGRENTGAVRMTLTDEAGKPLFEREIPMAEFADGQYTRIPMELEAEAGDVLTLTLATLGGQQGNTITFYCGSTIAAGRFDVDQTIAEEDRYTVNGERGISRLCVRVNGVKTLSFYKYYWPVVAAVFAAVALLCARWWRMALRGKNNPLVAVCTMLTRYQFLIKQLVSRDFKTKYKRSVLGMAWSFLNPLLTMSVQYVVFSTLFKSDVPNYPVYLLTGIVFMNFFNEAVSMGMTSITSNAQLIKKVYMPKYIYPVSRVISSLVNFVLAIIPLFLVMIFTGTAFRPALLLLVFDILCLVGFITGIGLLLTTAMTFFQDTQFLWGVVSMMWMYLTPVFYPESIIPANILPVYRMNPMYQYITFARVCIIDGVSPAPAAYLWCILTSVIVFTLGVVVFKKNQDKFVLYL